MKRTKPPGRGYSGKEFLIARYSTCYTGNPQRHRSSKEQRLQSLLCSLMQNETQTHKGEPHPKNGAQVVNSTEGCRDSLGEMSCEHLHEYMKATELIKNI